MAGLPGTIHVDNGADFRSHAFERACRDNGIQIDWRPPGTPHFGGHIERLIGTQMGAVRLLPGSTSSNIEERREYDAKRHATLTLRELERYIALEIVGQYHHLSMVHSVGHRLRSGGSRRASWYCACRTIVCNSGSPSYRRQRERCARPASIFSTSATGLPPWPPIELCMFAEGSRYQEELCAVGSNGKIECLVPGPGRFWPRHLGVAPLPQIIVSPRNPPGPRILEVPIDPASRQATTTARPISSMPASLLRCADKARWR